MCQALSVENYKTVLALIYGLSVLFDYLKIAYFGSLYLFVVNQYAAKLYKMVGN